jgi:hypothetical protein
MKIREFLTGANWGKGYAVATGRSECLMTATTICYPDHGEWLEVRKRIYWETSPKTLVLSIGAWSVFVAGWLIGQRRK